MQATRMGFLLVSFRLPFSCLLVWFPAGFPLFWFAFGFLLVSFVFWFPCGFLVVSFGFLYVGFLVVCF